jgi:4-alpha-glucanotransferase
MKPSLEKKLAGVLCPVFAIRTESDLGVGDTEGVRQMIDWCAEHGLSVLQILPINETGGDNSPYNAISSQALDPTTIAVSPRYISDLSAAKFDAIARPDLLAELRRGAVDYRRVKALKRDLLWGAFESFLAKEHNKKTSREKRFKLFVEQNADWLRDYALFRVLMEEHGNSPSWERWPKEHRDSQAARQWLESLPAESREKQNEKLLFFCYVQWIAFAQWVGLKEYGAQKRVYLMGDIPFGVGRASADVWADRTLFDLDWSGGAPPEATFKPDPFTEKWGQNWGIPLYRWGVMRERNFDWWQMRLGNVHKVFHIFRIDHVLGFYRIYAFPWPPERNREFADLTEQQAAKKMGRLLPRFFPGPDKTEKQKKTNCAQGNELLRMVRDAAGDTMVVAEDLGTVPDYVRPHLAKLGIPGFKIPHWERNPDYTYADVATYPRLSICTPATHDHDPLAAMWRRMWRDHEDAVAKQDHHRAHVTWLELQRFVWWLGYDGQNIPRDFTPEMHERYLRCVLESNSWLAIFMITDIFAQETRFNVPGSVAESNWSVRLDETVAELDKDPDLLAKTQMVECLAKETGRV